MHNIQPYAFIVIDLRSCYSNIRVQVKQGMKLYVCLIELYFGIHRWISLAPDSIPLLVSMGVLIN